MEEVRRIDRILKHQGSIVDFYDDIMEFPNGNTAHWDYIAHRKGAAAVLPVLEDGRILMVRQYRNAIERETLEIPAGARDSVQERTIDCAARECEEETGYRAGKIEPLVTVATTVAFCNEIVEVFLATELEKHSQHLDENEFLNVEAHTIDELKDMVLRREIQDSKTVAAILAYVCKIS